MELQQFDGERILYLLLCHSWVGILIVKGCLANRCSIAIAFHIRSSNDHILWTQNKSSFFVW